MWRELASPIFSFLNQLRRIEYPFAYRYPDKSLIFVGVSLLETLFYLMELVSYKRTTTTFECWRSILCFPSSYYLRLLIGALVLFLFTAFFLFA